CGALQPRLGHAGNVSYFRRRRNTISTPTPSGSDPAGLRPASQHPPPLSLPSNAFGSHDAGASPVIGVIAMTQSSLRDESFVSVIVTVSESGIWLPSRQPRTSPSARTAAVPW